MDIKVDLTLEESLKKAEDVAKVYYSDHIEERSYGENKIKGELVFVKCLDGSFFCKKFKI